MANLGGVGLRFRLDDLPFLPGAREYAEQWLFPAGANRNQEHFGCGVAFAVEIPDEMRLLLFTPETSGGLLLAVPPDRLAELQALGAEAGQAVWVVGEAFAGMGIRVE
jgi:selenide,water dikinase